MFQGCTVNRQNLALSGKATSRLLLVRIGRTYHVSCGDLSKSFTVPDLRPNETDDLFLLQIASAIPGPLARLIYTIRKFDWTLCASHNYRHFFQRRTAYRLRFALLSNLAAGAGPLVWHVCNSSAAMQRQSSLFLSCWFRIQDPGPQPNSPVIASLQTNPAVKQAKVCARALQPWLEPKP